MATQLFVEEVTDGKPTPELANTNLSQEDDSDRSILSNSSSTDDIHPPSTPNTSIDELHSISSAESDHGALDSVLSTDTGSRLDEDPFRWIFNPDHQPEDVEYVSGNIAGATVAALVEKLTPPDGVIDPAFSSAFFLTFRLFSSPVELAEIIKARYDLSPPPNISEIDEFLWQEQKGSVIRKSALQFAYTWLDQYWESGVDNPAFPTLQRLTSHCLAGKFFHDPGIIHIIYPLADILKRRLQELVEDLASQPVQTDDATSGAAPKRRITRDLLTSLRKKDCRNFSFMDFDTLELARQLTLMGSELFFALRPYELLSNPGDQSSTNIRAIETFSASIMNWVSESILHELDIKRRTWLVKFFINIADSCAQLWNFTVLRAILSALKLPRIARLQLTMSELSLHDKTRLESMMEEDDSVEMRVQRNGITHALDGTDIPGVPCIEWYLSAIASCGQVFPSHRKTASGGKDLVNLARYYKLAEIWQDFQRSQIPYNLKPIPELHVYLREVAFKTSKHLVFIPKTTVNLQKTSALPKQLPVSFDLRKRYGAPPQLQGLNSTELNAVLNPDPTPTNQLFSLPSNRFSQRVPQIRQSTSTTHSSSVATVYSNPHSSIGTLDYGIFYTRRAFSQDSLATPEWWAQQPEESSEGAD